MPEPQLRRRACVGAAAILLALVAWAMVAPAGVDGGSLSGADDAGGAPGVDRGASLADALAPLGVAPTRVAAPERSSGGVRLPAAVAAAVLALGAGALETIVAVSWSRRIAAPTAMGRGPAWWAVSVRGRAPPVLSG